MTRISVALVQFDAVPEQPARNLRQMERLAREAAAAGARWILFHEGTLTDYTPRLRELAEPVPGPSTRRMAALAREMNCFISFGLSEKRRGRYHISHVFVGPRRWSYCYRKTWLFHKINDRDVGYRDEWARYDPGDGPEPFVMDGVRATCFICADGGSKRCIERARLARPRVVFYPNNRAHIVSDAELSGHARAIGAPILSTNRVGRSWLHRCQGGCAVVGADGKILARANSRGREEILHFPLELA